MVESFKETLKKNNLVVEGFQNIHNNLKEVIKDLVAKLKNEMAGDEKNFEEKLSEMFSFVYKIDHSQYGKNVESIIRELIKEKLKDRSCSINETAKNNLGDIIITKNNKKVVIEVKSFIDGPSSKSSQSLKCLEETKKRLKREGYLYLVFATYEYFSKEYSEKFFAKEWRKKYQWVFLQLYDHGCKNIWDHENNEYKNYLPFHELVAKIGEQLKRRQDSKK